jgi:redox-sensitive bicupin YhaK (pirin superfamily)
MPEQTEGLMRGFQLWVNLPAKLKMTAPGYQEYPAARMPVEERDGGVRVKVITGATARGTAGPVSAPSTEARYFDVELPAGASFEEAIPAEHAALVVVYEGTVRFDDGKNAEALSLAQLGAGDAVKFGAKDKPARALVIAGKPLKEPVAWMGPFVMNTQQELAQAVEDYQAGRF